MGRLPLQGFYTLTSCIVDSAAIYIMVAKIKTLIVPLHSSFYFIRGLRWLPIQKEHSLYGI
jgi:hypothetical protein